MQSSPGLAGAIILHICAAEPVLVLLPPAILAIRAELMRLSYVTGRIFGLYLACEPSPLGCGDEEQQKIGELSVAELVMTGISQTALHVYFPDIRTRREGHPQSLCDLEAGRNRAPMVRRYRVGEASRRARATSKVALIVCVWLLAIILYSVDCRLTARTTDTRHQSPLGNCTSCHRQHAGLHYMQLTQARS